MSVPVIGQDPWGEDLNIYLGSLELRIQALEAAQPIPSAIYNYSNNTAVAPPSGVLRTNAAFGSESFLYLNEVTAAGINVSSYIDQINTTYQLYIEDADDAATRQWYHVTAAPMDMGNWWQIGVTHIAGTPNPPNNNRPVRVVFTKQTA